MPLSERENQILQDIERRLYEQDPRFAREVEETNLPAHLARNIRRGVVAFMAGFGILVFFFVRPILLIGVLAFLVMVAAATYTYQNLRQAGAVQIKTLREQAPFNNLFERLEQRFREIRNRNQT